MWGNRIVWWIICTGIWMMFATSSHAQMAGGQDVETGRRLYQRHCQVCHGPTGKGDGPLAKTTLRKVADLTTLQRANSGTYPADRIQTLIDGSGMSQTHAPSDMPEWGQVFRDTAPAYLGSAASPTEYKAFVARQIKTLVTFIGTLQRN